MCSKHTADPCYTVLGPADTGGSTDVPVMRAVIRRHWCMGQGHGLLHTDHLVLHTPRNVRLLYSYRNLKLTLRGSGERRRVR